MSTSSPARADTVSGARFRPSGRVTRASSPARRSSSSACFCAALRLASAAAVAFVAASAFALGLGLLLFQLLCLALEVFQLLLRRPLRRRVRHRYYPQNHQHPREQRYRTLFHSPSPVELHRARSWNALLEPFTLPTLPGREVGKNTRPRRGRSDAGTPDVVDPTIPADDSRCLRAQGLGLGLEVARAFDGGTGGGRIVLLQRLLRLRRRDSGERLDAIAQAPAALAQDGGVHARLARLLQPGEHRRGVVLCQRRIDRTQRRLGRSCFALASAVSRSRAACLSASSFFASAILGASGTMAAACCR